MRLKEWRLVEGRAKNVSVQRVLQERDRFKQKGGNQLNQRHRWHFQFAPVLHVLERSDYIQRDGGAAVWENRQSKN